MDIEFFALDDGTCRKVKMRAKVLQNVKNLKEFGHTLRKPYSAPIRDGIFELLTQTDGNITRILYFFYVGNVAVLTNGFVKKTRKTPVNEIETAVKYRKIYLERKAIENNG